MFEAEYEKGCCILPQNEESPYETASNRHTVKAPYCEITTVRGFFGPEKTRCKGRCRSGGIDRCILPEAGACHPCGILSATGPAGAFM